MASIMKWQICMTDEYGSTSIMNNVDDIAEAKKQARDAVHQENVANALTAEEKKRHWSYFFVEVFDGIEPSQKVVYGGRDSKGHHCVFGVQSGETESAETATGELRLFLGNLDGQDWYAEDQRGNLITAIDHPLLQDKAFYFIRKAGR